MVSKRFTCKFFREFSISIFPFQTLHCPMAQFWSLWLAQITRFCHHIRNGGESCTEWNYYYLLHLCCWDVCWKENGMCLRVLGITKLKCLLWTILHKVYVLITTLTFYLLQCLELLSTEMPESCLPSWGSYCIISGDKSYSEVPNWSLSPASTTVRKDEFNPQVLVSVPQFIKQVY